MSHRGPEQAETIHLDGEDASLTGSVDRAAVILRTARRVLLTGLTDATLEAIRVACDIAESLGATIDAGDPDMARPLGPIVIRAGSVTADPEELRDRADLVVLWFCRPSDQTLALADAFITPHTAGGARRHVIAVGTEPLSFADRHLPLPRASEVDAARLLHAILLGHGIPAGNDAAAAIAETCTTIAAAIEAAMCVAIVTDDSDPTGLGGWAVSLLVRSMAHGRPAFAVPLVGALPATHTPRAAAVLTWRYGAEGAIARADQLGADFRPAECSAAALIARGEVDAVLAVGPLPSDVEDVIARAHNLAVVRVDPAIPALVALRDRILAGGSL